MKFYKNASNFQKNKMVQLIYQLERLIESIHFEGHGELNVKSREKIWQLLREATAMRKELQESDGIIKIDYYNNDELTREFVQNTIKGVSRQLIKYRNSNNSVKAEKKMFTQKKNSINFTKI